MSRQQKLWGAFIGGVVLVFLVYTFWSKKESRVVYKEVVVGRENIDVVILSTGTVEPQNRLELKSPVAGRIEEIMVREGDAVKKGQIIAWMSSSERAALLDAARSAGSLEVKKWEKDYKPTPVISPIDGMVILRSVEPGQSFSTSEALFTISDRLIVKAQVDETDIGQIDVGQETKIILDAYPSKDILARVDHIAFDAETVSNVTTYRVEVLPESVPQFMKSGMTANVIFAVTKAENVLVVPASALTVQEQKKGVLVKTKENNRGEFRSLELGINDGKRYEVLSGLSETDIILVPDAAAVAAGNKGTNPFGPFSRKKK